METNVTDPPTIILTVPIPPSANRIWRRVPGMKGLKLSQEYQSWRETAGWAAKMQLMAQGGTIKGAFRARIEVPKSRRDLDNWVKPLFDLCQAAGAIRDDSGATHFEIEPADRADCMIALWDLGGPELPEPKARKPRSVRTMKPRYDAAKDPRVRATKRGIAI
jgi:Holliday junction resolvase RusA-like endonuclease